MGTVLLKKDVLTFLGMFTFMVVLPVCTSIQHVYHWCSKRPEGTDVIVLFFFCLFLVSVCLLAVLENSL